MLALGQGLRVGDDPLQLGGRDTRHGEQAVMDGELDLAHDVEAVAKEEVIVPVDATPERILHREDRTVRDPELHGLECRLELIARHRLAIRVSFPRRRLAISPWYTLIGDPECRAVHRGRREVGYGERFR